MYTTGPVQYVGRYIFQIFPTVVVLCTTKKSLIHGQAMLLRKRNIQVHMAGKE